MLFVVFIPNMLFVNARATIRVPQLNETLLRINSIKNNQSKSKIMYYFHELGWDLDNLNFLLLYDERFSKERAICIDFSTLFRRYGVTFKKWPSFQPFQNQQFKLLKEKPPVFIWRYIYMLRYAFYFIKITPKLTKWWQF